MESDAQAVHEVEAAAFETDLQARIVDELRKTADPQLSLVAIVEGEIVGHIFFSPATIDGDPRVRTAQLSPVAVRPAWQRKGVGSALIREGLSRCRDAGWESVFLLGDPRYYSRLGFKPAVPMGFTFGDPKADAALQVLELRAQALSGKSGRVRFHPAFDLAEA
jgi:putative acetyltransferase